MQAVFIVFKVSNILELNFRAKTIFFKLILVLSLLISNDPLNSQFFQKNNGQCTQNCSTIRGRVEEIRELSAADAESASAKEFETDDDESSSAVRETCVNSTKAFCLQPPYIFCEDSDKDFSFHTVVLKWTVRRALNLTYPVVFVIEGKEVSAPGSESGSAWEPYTKVKHFLSLKYEYISISML